MTRSSLEQYAGDSLVENGIEFEYEPVKVVLLDSFESSNVGEDGKGQGKTRPITYKPDFVGSNGVIETKGYFRGEDRLRGKLFKSLMPVDINIFMPRNRIQVDEVIQIIKTNEQQGERKDGRLFQIPQSIQLPARVDNKPKVSKTKNGKPRAGRRRVKSV